MAAPDPPSSMKIKFTREVDIKQACYEAALDIVAYVDHLMGIAKRCEENFPEVANGLQGSAAGITQYLRGVDGKWQTRANEELRGILSTPEFRDHLWAYEFARDPRAAQLMIGAMAGVAAAKPDLSFWEVLKITRTKLTDVEPLIEKLLGTSPRRAQ